MNKRNFCFFILTLTKSEMINEKNMFTYKIKRRGIDSIVPDDPSNIFELTKKRKVVNFDSFVPKKKNIVIFDSKHLRQTKQNLKCKKDKKNICENKIKNTEQARKFVLDDKKISKLSDKQEKENAINKLSDLRNINSTTNIACIYKNIPSAMPPTSTFIDDSYNTLNISTEQNSVYETSVTNNDAMHLNKKCDTRLALEECRTLNDLILHFCNNNKSEYGKKLCKLVLKNRDLFNSINDNEVKEIETRIQILNTQKQRWSLCKNRIQEKSILELKIFLDKTSAFCAEHVSNKEMEDRIQCNRPVQTNEHTDYTNKIISKEQNYHDTKNVDLEENVAKIRFLKESMKNCIYNIRDRLDELESKIFNLTASEREVDAFILLNAFTKYN